MALGVLISLGAAKIAAVVAITKFAPETKKTPPKKLAKVKKKVKR